MEKQQPMVSHARTGSKPLGTSTKLLSSCGPSSATLEVGLTAVDRESVTV